MIGLENVRENKKNKNWKNELKTGVNKRGRDDVIMMPSHYILTANIRITDTDINKRCVVLRRN